MRTKSLGSGARGPSSTSSGRVLTLVLADRLYCKTPDNLNYAWTTLSEVIAFDGQVEDIKAVVLVENASSADFKVKVGLLPGYDETRMMGSEAPTDLVSKSNSGLAIGTPLSTQSSIAPCGQFMLGLADEGTGSETGYVSVTVYIKLWDR